MINNADFIKKYGKFEFYDMCSYISQQLTLAKMEKKINNFRFSNRKKVAKFYRKGKDSVYVDFATIFQIGCDKLQQYVDNK